MEPITEDSVQCLLFSCVTNTNIYSHENSLAKLCEEVNLTIKTLSQDYIWHREEFTFNAPIILDKNRNGTPLHLTSVTCFGDNIEDEWFILYIVLETTKLHPNIIVQIKDSDGEFILIEAADYLPQWVNPDTTVNRVFLYNGHIHLISPELVNLETNLSISDALRIVTQSPERTQVIDNIEKAVFERIGNYPQKIYENTHHTVVNIPAELAALLTLDPKLIAPIVTTYCNHDLLEAKMCVNMSFDDCIDTKVKFTKCLYSMLVHSKLINNVYLKKNDTDGTNIGLKLTIGFNMILKSSTDMYSTKSFANFLGSLKEKGYFKGNIEGSQEYKQLLENAKTYYANNECSVNLHVCKKMEQLMSTDEFIMLKEKLILDKDNSTLSGDSNDWLNIHPEHLNELLNRRYGKEAKYKNNDIVTAQTITNELSNFLHKSSDFDGIETNNNENVHNSNNIDFEVDTFNECIEKFLNFLVSDENQETDDESDTNDDEEYEFNYTDDTSADFLDKEIKSKLSLEKNIGTSKNILQNIVQSLKEEKSSAGPSSTLLKSVGINKSYILDSDDDEE
ncbi:hypothetical protein K1T71_006104 [Dendrolimus kikuchii]|uniref:Uncharacterized protein n=1 Tax=Dendrolimus kikuchii TaxID=765133 RepID=A0ACC1D390_9NEOP|nr:hypothetical protein K1T71_006104 [Dendrolimus kikuchii]